VEELNKAWGSRKMQLDQCLKLLRSQTLQQFSRDADESETLGLEKLTLAQEENYKENNPSLPGPRGPATANSATPAGILVRSWEEELRGYNRAIDLTLHTILEESGKDSEPE